MQCFCRLLSLPFRVYHIACVSYSTISALLPRDKGTKNTASPMPSETPRHQLNPYYQRVKTTTRAPEFFCLLNSKRGGQRAGIWNAEPVRFNPSSIWILALVLPNRCAQRSSPLRVSAVAVRIETIPSISCVPLGVRKAQMPNSPDRS